jgi:hypothetical protein
VLSGRFATPVRGSDVADESAEDELPVAVVDDEPDEPDEPVAMLDRPLLSVEEEVNVPAEPEGEELDDELESNGCAMRLPAWSLLRFPPRARRLTPRPGRHN